MDHKPGKYKVADLSLAQEGNRLIEWAESRMPVLMTLREKYRKTKPFKGYKIAGCLRRSAGELEWLQSSLHQRRCCCCAGEAGNVDLCVARDERKGILLVY
jgi:hypothetical protein